MKLTKNEQVVDLSNENHINAFLSSGWVEVKASAPSQKIDEVDEVMEITPEPKKKAETKKPVTKKKQEK